MVSGTMAKRCAPIGGSHSPETGETETGAASATVPLFSN